MSRKYILIVLSVFGVAFVVGTQVTLLRSQPNMVQQKAFTVEMTQVSKSARGTVEKVIVEAYRTDGSRVEAPKTTGSLQERLLVFPTDLQKVRVNDRLQMKSTHTATPPPGVVPPAGGKIARGPRCEILGNRGQESKYIGEERVLGYVAFRYQHPVSFVENGKQIRTTSWYVPDLSCYELQQHGESVSSTGQITGTYDKVSIAVRVGDPDPELFRIPAEYKEVAPSELERAALSIATKEANDSGAFPQVEAKMRQKWEQEDKRYYDARQHLKQR